MCSVIDVKTNLCLQVNDTTTLDPTLYAKYYKPLPVWVNALPNDYLV